MKIIGITGGVGAGKSTVLNFLKEMCNCETVMADDVAKSLMKKGSVLTDTAYSLFGRDAYLENGNINAAHVGQIIFSDSAIRKQWEEAVHPAVKNKILNLIKKAVEEGKEFFFLEAALLIEDNYEEICEEIWYVYADEDVRRIRLKETRAYSDEKTDSILNAQLKDSEYRQHSAYIIDTGISLEYTRAQLENKLAEYRTL